MSLLTTNTKDSYNGDEVQSDFPVTFVFWETSDLSVILRDVLGVETPWTEGTQYTVTGGNGSTGNVIVETAPTDYRPQTGEKLLIKSARTDTQGAEFPLSGPFRSTVAEQAFDQAVRLIQQKAEEIARSILLPETSALSDLTIPEPGAGELIRWNPAGTGLDTVAAASLSVSALDTLISGVADGDTLEYDAAQTLWVNKATGFKVSPQSSPNMTVRIGLGSFFRLDTGVIVDVAAQNSATIVAPATNPRNDIVYIDRISAVVGVAAGAEAASPTDPTIPTGKLPVARVRLATSTTTIVAGLIDDIRELAQLGWRTGTTAGDLMAVQTGDRAPAVIGTFGRDAPTAKTTNYAIVAADVGQIIPFDATASARTPTLPLLSSVGEGFSVGVVRSSGTNAVVVDEHATDGGSTLLVIGHDEVSWFSKVSGVWASVGGAIRVLDRDMSLASITGTSEQTLYSFTVPGGMLGVNNALRCSIKGQIGPSLSTTMVFRFKYGATTLFEDTTSTFALSTIYAYEINLTLAALDSASSQGISGIFSSVIDGATTGAGNLASGFFTASGVFNGTAAEDSSADKALTVTVQMTNSNVVTARQRLLEWLK